MPGGNPVGFDHTVLIAAPPARILGAFFDPVALAAWWQTLRSVTASRALGVYAVEWEATSFQDELLGPLGGVFYGTVIEFQPDRAFFVADAYWLPPRGEPVGPMALEVSCTSQDQATALRVRQTGYEDSARWHRYYMIIEAGWKTSLRSLKAFLEQGSVAARAADPDGR